MSNKFLSREPNAAITNIKTCFNVSFIIALLSALLRSVSFVTSFDTEIGYFNGSLFSAAVTYLMVLGCIFAAVCYFFISKEAKLPVKLDGAPNSVFFTSCFAGFVLLADFAYKIFGMIVDDRFKKIIAIFAPNKPLDNAYFMRATALIEIFGVLASLIAAVYFFLRATKKSNSKLAVWLGFFPILRALTGVALVYFEMEIQMNHPSKMMLQFALIAVMLCLLYELRFGVSEAHPRPRLYFVSACIAFILSFTCGVSEMFAYLAGYLGRGDFFAEAFFCLTMSLYILARLNTFVRAASATAPEQPAPEEIVSE